MASSSSKKSGLQLHVYPDCLSRLPAMTAFKRRFIRWDPQGFVIENDRLEQKIIEASVQQKSLDIFQEYPSKPMTYVVAGNPDDEKAKYFAAYLCQIHLDKLGVRADIAWEHIYNGFEHPLINSDKRPTLLVIDNLTVRSNNLKYDKARDLIVKFSSIPKIVVVAGEDPISFAQTKLHVPAHGIAYFGNTLSKQVNEVI